MDALKRTSSDANNQAPEVSYRDEGLIVAAAYTNEYSPQHHLHQQVSDKWEHAHSGSTPAQPYPPPHHQQRYEADTKEQASPELATAVPPKRKWFTVWTLGLIIGIICALGAGIGIGYVIGDHTNHSSEPNGSTSNSTQQSTVTAGSTGIGAFDCDPDKVYASPFGQSLAQECYVSYKTNQSAYDNSSLIVQNFAGLTVYSFETCMDQCVQRNKQLSIGNILGDACTAVSYYANLTYSIPAWAGNCFLKNAKGIGKNWDTNSNASLTASAYLVTLS